MNVCRDPQVFASVDPDASLVAFLAKTREVLAFEVEGDQTAVCAVVVGCQQLNI